MHTYMHTCIHACPKGKFRVQTENLTPNYKLSESENETFRHLLAGCAMLSHGPNKRRHDRMSLRVYLELC